MNGSGLAMMPEEEQPQPAFTRPVVEVGVDPEGTATIGADFDRDGQPDITVTVPIGKKVATGIVVAVALIVFISKMIGAW